MRLPATWTQGSNVAIVIEHLMFAMISLRVAGHAGFPVSCVHVVHEAPEVQVYIRMDYIRRRTLDELPPTLPVEQKEDIARQLREIVRT